MRDVRDRLRRGQSPIPEQRRSHTSNASPREARKRIDPLDVPRVLESLAKDPSLRMTQTGRNLLQWLHLRRVDVRDCRMVVDSVPTHRLGAVVELARVYASIWETIATQLETQIPHDMAS